MRVFITLCRRLRRVSGVALSLGLLVACASPARADGYRVGQVIGGVLVRGKSAGVPGRLHADAVLPPEAAILVTNAGARVELFDDAGARWRLGSLAVWLPEAEGARLLSGTVLVEVPAGQTRVLDAVAGRAVLAEGLWMVQAVANDGLKLICVDGPATVGATLPGTEGAKPDSRELRPGDVVFLRPGGREFGPVVTIFLREMLVTSRLINGFAQPLPQAKHLSVLGAVQAERLKRVTNVFVGGARDAAGFQLVVPKPPKKSEREH